MLFISEKALQTLTTSESIIEQTLFSKNVWYSSGLFFKSLAYNQDCSQVVGLVLSLTKFNNQGQQKIIN